MKNQSSAAETVRLLEESLLQPEVRGSPKEVSG
jgi:hypothetical protein